MIQNNNSYTIASLSEDINKSIRYRIPIYQRLFVWDEKQINQLLDDLHKASEKAEDNPYYIGIITIVKRGIGDVWEIVDGQQRLTFLTLFAALAEGEDFNCFLFNDKSLRMEYVGREHDSEDIKYIIENKFDEIKNVKIKKFVSVFDFFIKRIEHKDKFFKFVRTQATFLCSKLDRDYTPHELNRHFERINATGRQLEPQDIIKGKYFSKYAPEINRLIDFSKKYTQDGGTKTSNENKPSQNQKSSLTLLNILNFKKDDKKFYNEPTLKGPKSVTRAIFSESTFMLHILMMAIDDESLSLNQYNIVEIFSGKMIDNDHFTKYFICKMKKYREWLDKNIIYITENGFKFRFQDNEKSKDKKLEKLLQYQSMLVVSSSASQEWVLKAYEESKGGNLTLKHLKEIDNRPLPRLVDMCYGKIERYWFWKLDYLLWEICFNGNPSSGKEPIKVNIAGHEFKFFNKQLEAIKNYSFKENRSIEHLHPQSSLDSFGDQLDSFGNLAMISASFNSAQGNDAINTKFGRLQDRLKNKQNLESIKLLLMFKLSEEENNVWNEKLAKQHGQAMYLLLASSHRQNPTPYVYGFNKTLLKDRLKLYKGAPSHHPLFLLKYFCIISVKAFFS